MNDEDVKTYAVLTAVCLAGAAVGAGAVYAVMNETVKGLKTKNRIFKQCYSDALNRLAVPKLIEHCKAMNDMMKFELLIDREFNHN